MFFVDITVVQSAQHIYEKREGSGSGSVPLTNGSGAGSGRPKNLRILRIRIRIPNTVYKMKKQDYCTGLTIAHTEARPPLMPEKQHKRF